MKKSKGSTSVDCLYMESMLNKQIRSNIHFKSNALDSKTIIIKLIEKYCKQITQLVQEDTKDQQQMIIQFQDNKILMSQLYQPMVIHSHRVLQNNKNCTFESPKFKRNCFHLDNGQVTLKHSHYLKKGGQYIQTSQQQQETKPWHPFIRMRRKKFIQNLLEQKLTQESQPIQGSTCFQPIADLSGWQTQEEPQIE